MRIQLVHSVEFVTKPGGNQIMAMPKITTEDGQLVAEGDPVEVKAGNSMHYGPFPVHVQVSGDFHSGQTVNTSVADHAGAPSQAKPAPTPGHARR